MNAKDLKAQYDLMVDAQKAYAIACEQFIAEHAIAKNGDVIPGKRRQEGRGDIELPMRVYSVKVGSFFPEDGATIFYHGRDEKTLRFHASHLQTVAY